MKTITRSLLLLVVVWAVARSSPAPAPSCPEGCRCATTAEGLHKAACSSLLTLQKYALRNKHHNINVIDLSKSKITKLNGELDRFTEIVSLDLSSNEISHLKLTRGWKKLVHLNLSSNKLKRLSVSILPSSISSLDLSHNMLHDVPTNLGTLPDLEHLVLRGNPLHCTCSNIKELDRLRTRGIVIDDVKCIEPLYAKGISWSELKASDICVDKKDSSEKSSGRLLEDMMMGDQPFETENIGEDTVNRKSMPFTNLNLDAGEVWEGSGGEVNDDDKVFLGVTTENSNAPSTEQPDIFESSGDSEIFDTEDLLISRKSNDLSAPLKMDSSVTEEPGSGDFGSGLNISDVSSNEISSDLFSEYEYEGSGGNEDNHSSTTTEPFITGMFNPFFQSGMDQNSSTSEEPFIPKISVFQGNVDWETEPSEKPSTEEAIVKETIEKSESNTDVEGGVPLGKGNVEPLNEDLQEESKQTLKSSVGTYICIGIIIAILVCLIGVTIIRGQSRKRRDQRLMRQQKKDVEKAGKEMVDMNKSLLGKPVITPNETQKKSNGNYELVPTHDPRKSNKNGTLESNKSVDENTQKAEAPQQLAQSPNTNAKTNGVPSENKSIPRVEEPSIDLPFNSDYDGPFTNGGSYPTSNLLPSPSEYIPVYNPDSGRVRIKLTETPKPKTPVLITRSRSNAGEIIITPSPEQISPSKSTT